MQTREEWLRAYDALDGERERVSALFEAANEGEESYERADTARFDLNELETELTHAAADLLRVDFGQVLNAAADDVLSRCTPNREEARDLVNLLVNLTMSRLSNPAVTVEDAIRENYDPQDVCDEDEDVVEHVLAWLP